DVIVRICEIAQADVQAESGAGADSAAEVVGIGRGLAASPGAAGTRRPPGAAHWRAGRAHFVVPDGSVAPGMATQELGEAVGAATGRGTAVAGAVGLRPGCGQGRQCDDQPLTGLGIEVSPQCVPASESARDEECVPLRVVGAAALRTVVPVTP